MSSMTAQIDQKKKWVDKMIKSAKKYHKICPYYDKKTNSCFLRLGGKCDRDGKFDTCPVFIEFLEKKYDSFVRSGRPLPVDFMDPAMISP